MNTSLRTDPFESHQNHGENKSEGSQVKPADKVGQNQNRMKEGINSDDDSFNESVLSSIDNALDRGGNDFYKEEVISRLELEFKEIQVKKGTSNLTADLTTNALWVIESPNIYEGGNLKWEDSYRIKHFTSGRYLKVTRRSANVSP